MTDENLPFEAGLKELETIVSQMEEGHITLADSLTFYERGVFLQKRLTAQLDAAKLRIQKIEGKQITEVKAAEIS